MKAAHPSLAALALLAGCVAPEPGRVSRMMHEEPEGACWASPAPPGDIAGAVARALAEPAAGFAADEPFETPCPDVLTADLIASLQRALAARGLYGGEISGEMDAGTEAAVRLYQAPFGVDSGTLSVAAARRLGLLKMPRRG